MRADEFAAPLLVAMAVALGTQASAHRRDEYLQAARIGIERDRVAIELDLTAGIAVADKVVAAIDRNQSGTISADEADAYGVAVGREVDVEIDGRRLSIVPRTSSFPTTDAIRKGEGTIRIELSAATPRLGDGLHHLRFRNGHRRDISVYLANALVPIGDGVVIAAQRRDVAQRELIVDYVLRNDTTVRRDRVDHTMVSPRASISTSAAILFARPAAVLMLLVRNASAKRFCRFSVANVLRARTLAWMAARRSAGTVASFARRTGA